MSQDAAQPGELREDEDFTTALYRAAIGPVNTDYYLTLFTRWEASSRFKPHWNTAAGLWTLGWLMFRKMGGAALAYVGALVGSLLLVFGIGRLLVDFSGVGLATAFALWLLTVVLVPGLWGNVVFHSHCRKRMAQALAAHSDVAQSCASLATASSLPRRAMVVGAVQAGVLAVLALAGLQFATLIQHVSLPAVATDLATPQMASGRVKEMPSAPAIAVSAPVLAPTVAASAPAIAPVAVLKAASAPASSPASSPAAALPAKAASAPVSVAKKASAPATAVSAIAKATSAPAATGRYGVNVGLFAKPKNAETARAKLEAASLSTHMDTLNMPNGPRMRVRVGPFTSQAQADAAALKIKSLGLDAMTYRE
jgi:cell division septation protein DedD